METTITPYIFSYLVDAAQDFDGRVISRTMTGKVLFSAQVRRRWYTLEDVTTMVCEALTSEIDYGTIVDSLEEYLESTVCECCLDIKPEPLDHVHPECESEDLVYFRGKRVCYECVVDLVEG
jgi:hypothetical protein